MALNRWRLRNCDCNDKLNKTPNVTSFRAQRDVESERGRMLKRQSNAWRGVCIGFHHSRLNLRWRWTANGKKWVVIEFWCRAGARKTFSVEFSAKMILQALAKLYFRNSSSVAYKKLSTTSTAACQDGFSAKTLDFFIRPHNYARERATFFCCGK